MKILAFFLMMVLTGCGFTPMYGQSAQKDKGALQNIEISLIPDQAGVELRNLLIDAFYKNGYPTHATYRLEVSTLRETVSDLDITTESEATRRQIRIAADMVLIDLSSAQQTVLQRTVTATTSYNVLGSQFTTRVSENDAREAALHELARQIETQTVLYFKR